MEFAIVLGGGQVGQVISKGIDNIVEQAQLAESLGFTAVFVPDHYVFEEMGDFKKGQPAYEIFFLMTMLAQTTGLTIGSHVACTIFRHPAMLARLFAHVDEVAGGRVIAGVGAGWTKAEFDMLGIDFPHVSERLRMMDEAVTVMRGLWREEPFSFEGEYYKLTDAQIRPLPTRVGGPPIMLGGSGKGILRRAGQWADIVHLVPETGGPGTTTMEKVAEFTDAAVADKLSLVRESALAAGRPADAVSYATTIFSYNPATTPAQAQETAEGMGALFGVATDDIIKYPCALVGTPDQMEEELRRRQEAHGLSLVAVGAAGPDGIRNFADNLISRFA
jgi:probable F420-dependent oxidoreductase